MSLPPGAWLGPYQVLAPLGAGGMGEVYRAKDTRLGRDVAIKVLPTAFANDPDRLRRFEQEARAAGALNHPNILVIHDIGAHDDVPYVVSELLEGETLRARLNTGTLPQRKAVEYAQAIAHGLAAAHAKGIVHRDLKPENLFITKDSRVKILDFGLAKLTHPDLAGECADAPTVSVHTALGVVLGTLGYMSPEQVRGRPTDHRCDIFSFGAILYEMLSGQRAFGGQAVEVMSAILRDDPVEVSKIHPGVSPALERVVRRCLEKDPEERFQSARDLGFALEALSGSSTSGTVAPLAAPLLQPGAWDCGPPFHLPWSPCFWRASSWAGKPGERQQRPRFIGSPSATARCCRRGLRPTARRSFTSPPGTAVRNRSSPRVPRAQSRARLGCRRW
ncbi:MAG: serine/threonine protein kinase [Acidobacteria bacterium]|nr:serine/threonine protein kinase [Acidobacteriota bacterium]